MKSTIMRWVIAITILTMLALPARLAAAAPISTYTLIDPGTFGGPNSYWSLPSPLVNDQGTLIGTADLNITDPFAPNNCFNAFMNDCFVSSTFAYQHGVKQDLGALPGTYNSFPNWISPNGLMAGISENGLVDPLTGQPEFRGVLWQDGRIRDLGDPLGGNWSAAAAVNDRGQVVGVATNAIPDSFPAALAAYNFFDFPWPAFGATQNRAYLWQNGHMQDLGTLGTGSDAEAAAINQAGQVTGWSTTTTTPNPTTDIPTVHPFFWDHGTMQDLPTLGGTFAYPIGINDRGEVAGTSTLPGDQTYHPFLWTGGGKPRDLATPNQALGQAHWINQEGDVAGWAFANQNTTVHGFLWKNGAEIDLDGASSDACAFADMVNAQDQVVGGSCDGNALLWQDGATSDLNTLLASPSSDHLTEAFAINDRGEIAAGAVLPNGDTRLVRLVPNGASQAGASSVSASSMLQPAGSVHQSYSSPMGNALRALLRGLRTQSYHLQVR